MAEKRCTCAAHSAAECICGAWDKPSASVDELMKLADEAIHAYAAWLAEFTTGDLQSFNVARLNEEKDAARRKLRTALEGACGVLTVQAPSGRVLPNPGSPEASAMLDSMLAEYQWPANSKNAARAGWEAANRWLMQDRAAGVKVEGDGHA